MASLVSPLKSDREIARALNDAAKLPFIEVYVATPREECERRDPKGLYARARAGGLKGLTGVDAPYEPPDSADLVLDTTSADIDQRLVSVGLDRERAVEVRPCRHRVILLEIGFAEVHDGDGIISGLR